MKACTPHADDVFGPQVISCREGFDFTLLFEQSILSTVPSALVIIVSSVCILYLSRQDKKTRGDAGWSLKVIKQVSILCFVALQLVLIVLWAFPANNPTRVSVPASVLSMVAGLVLAVLSSLEHTRSARPSTTLNGYLLLSILFDLTQTRTLWLREDNAAVAAVFTAGLGLKFIVLLAEMIPKRRLLEAPYSDYPPEALSGLLNRGVFWWINSLLVKGSSTTLRLSDLFELDTKLTSEYIAPRFRRSWELSAKQSSHSLLWAALKCFWLKFMTIVVFRLCLIGFKFCQPLLINRAVSLLLQPESDDKTNTGRALIGATAFIYIGIAVTTGAFRHNVYRLITMMRGGLITLIYDTTLALDTRAASDSAALTLMSTDITCIASGFEVFDCLWAGPIEITIAVYLLNGQIGLSFIAPIIVSLIFVSVSVALRRVSAEAQKSWLEAIQRRVVTTATTLSNMKAIKMTGLADSVSNQIQALRVAELKVSARFRNVLGVSTTIATMSPAAIPTITLITYVLVMQAEQSVNLNAVVAFTTLSTVALLANPIQDIAKAAPQIAAAVGCFQRIQEYICSSGKNKEITNLPQSSESSQGEFELSSIQTGRERKESLALLVVQGASFAFPSMSDALLHDITLSIIPGTLTVLLGPIGCGKSMLLLALLRELRLVKGSMYRSPSLDLGYCAQDPWLPNLSIRQLIISHGDLDEAWYSTVLKACVLETDLKALPCGDQTMIGSNGVSLSGGQKQRLSLARALYSRKTVLLLDDVFSGLDPTTEHKIAINLFGDNALFRRHGITVFLATHSVGHARGADHVIVMEKGGIIQEQGPPQKIKLLDQPDWDSQLSQDDTSPSFSPELQADSAQETLLDHQDSRAAETQVELTRPTGDIRLYTYYIRSLGWFNAAGMILLISIFSVFLKVPTVWVQHWSNAEMIEPGRYTNMYAGVYGLLCGLCLLSLSSVIFLLFRYGIPRSSIGLHLKLLRATMQAPHWFFVSTDTGHILNRFSQDMSLLCLELPFAFLDTLFNAGVCIVGAVLITLASKWSATVYPVLIAVLYILQKFYLRTSRQIRLLDLEAKSPLYSHFLQTLRGLVTIRAFGWQRTSAKENAAFLDSSQRPFYLMYSIQRWLSLVLDLLTAAVAVLIISLAIQLQDSSAGALGVSLVNILTFSQDLMWLIRTWTELETSLGAIARVRSFEYDTPREDRDLTDKSTELPPEWPSRGQIVIQGLCSSYRAGAELVLKDLNIEIEPKSKVGICGRTGSGKSTFLLTLLGMAEIESGDIFIDGISTKTVLRNTLRQRIIALPQEAFLLSGTVRWNVDPFANHTDEAILSVLAEVGMLEHILAQGGLDAPVDAIPFSRGEHQLFCLARAILSKSNIVALDEMSSNVDAATEDKMMQVVSRKFSDRTVLAVAHHLRTIRKFDTIIVLDEGRIIETGSPDELLGKQSVFRELWERQR